MPEQLDINGNVQPVSWDGEPVYSPETVAEGLFDGGAFEQTKGQMAADQVASLMGEAWSGPGGFFGRNRERNS